MPNTDSSKVFYYFEKISQIPHGSHNTEKLAEYCISFAKNRGLEVRSDEAGNLAIIAPGSPGYESAEPVILQGHLDMVCEKTEECPLNMETDPIKLCCDGDFIKADGTTLGGDDGIAIAMILALLDSKEIPHPPIEALFTADEEVGLAGAANLSITGFKASRLINLDSETEGVLTVSCAGGVRIKGSIPFEFEKCPDQTIALELAVSKLRSGHSGIDISKNRANAIVLMGQIITGFIEECDVRTASFICDGRENVIPKDALCVFILPAGEEKLFKDKLTEITADIRTALALTEPELAITVRRCETPEKCLTETDTKKLAFALQNLPNGVYSVNPEVDGMTRTSSNAGCARLDEDGLSIKIMARSNLDCELKSVKSRFAGYFSFLGGNTEFSNEYPAWPYRKYSPLRELMIERYKECYGALPSIESIHAGLECGILTGKLGDMDMVSIGPDLYDVHSPNERMSIESVKRTWQYLLSILEAMKK